MRPIHPERARGFTLIEMVVVLTILGILMGVVAVFIQRPMEGIIDMTRRAELADTADTALRRMQRDLQRALPNSVRVTSSGATQLIEFLPTISGGRYCAEAGTTVGGSACTALDFTQSASSFGFIGNLPGFDSSSATQISEVAIYNLGIPGSDAYNGDNTTPFTRISGNTVIMTGKQFPAASPGNRFHLIGKPVSYACTPATGGNDGTGTLMRVSGYSKLALQPAAPASLTGASNNLLASRVAGCTIDYQQAAIDQNGLLTITLTIRRNNEQVTLTHAIAIHNVP
jgi:MSHA biogenesis protein MshO